MISEDLVDQFSSETKLRDDIDPDDEMCWLSLTYGWALAKGLSPTEAHEFALHIRYHTDLG